MSTKPDSSQRGGGPRGRGSSSNRGGRGRGRGRGRTNSISSLPDSPVNSTKSPATEKPSLLARIDLSGAAPFPRSPTSASSPASPSEASSPRGRGGSHRRRKSSAPSPSTPTSRGGGSIPSPLSRAPPAKSPLSASIKDLPTHVAVSEAPNLPPVAETSKAAQAAAGLEPLKPAGELLAPSSPMPSSRPFTPQGRDWAADDDDDDEGSLPSLDDWGFSGLKTASEAGDVSQERRTTDSMAKLSLTTDLKVAARGRRSGSAPPSAIERADGTPSFTNIIPPTPIAINPEQSGPLGGPGHRPSPLNPMTNGIMASPNRSGRILSRSTSPQPLNLGQPSRSTSPAAPLGSPSLLPGSRPSSPRPISGGVALGVRSRPTSPAPGSPGFGVKSVSPGRASFDLAMGGARPGSPGFALGSRPGSPSLTGGFDPSRSRQPSPGRSLSGGVALGVSRPSSPNPEGFRPSSPAAVPTLSNLSASRPKEVDTAPTWRSSLRKEVQPSPTTPTQAPLPQPSTEQPAQPESTQTVPLASRFAPGPIPPFRGGRGRGNSRGFQGGGGGMGRGSDHPRGGGRGGAGGPFNNFHPSQPRPHPSNDNTNQASSRNNNSFASLADESTSSTPPTRPPINIRGAFNSKDKDSPAASPTSTSGSPGGRGSSRGHGRTHSRPIISPTALSRLGASLASPRRPAKPSNPSAAADVAPVGGQ